MLLEANILPAGLWHPAAPSLFTILHLLRPLVLFLELPRGTTEEVPDALLPGGCGTGAHGVPASVLALCCRCKIKTQRLQSQLKPYERPSFTAGVALAWMTDRVWSMRCWGRVSWLNWRPVTCGEQKLQQLQNTRSNALRRQCER